MMWLSINAPDGRRIRQQFASVAAATVALVRGYSVHGVVHLADDRGESGFVAPLEGPTVMTGLLDAHGDELLAWLDAKGLKITKKDD